MQKRQKTTSRKYFEEDFDPKKPSRETVAKPILKQQPILWFLDQISFKELLQRLIKKILRSMPKSRFFTALRTAENILSYNLVYCSFPPTHTIPKVHILSPNPKNPIWKIHCTFYDYLNFRAKMTEPVLLRNWEFQNKT